MSDSEKDTVENEEDLAEIEFNKIPVSVLRQKVRRILSQSLNQIKIIPSENGLPRDWRGIADLSGLRSCYGQMIQNQTDPIEKVLELWCSKDYQQTASIDNLIKFLVEIDRWDVLCDINEYLLEDAKLYLKNIKRKENSDVCSNTIKQVNQSEKNLLTVDDVYNAQKKLPPQFYDAFVLFDESDEDFAAELINRMEKEGFKLCFKERDLIGGISFEHQAVMRLISERCNRLIVIYSPEFLKSPTNTYLVNYAQSLGIENGQRKILPCLYKYCDLPRTLNFMWRLDYNRSSKFVNFWDKLRDSIQQTSFVPEQRNIDQRSLTDHKNEKEDRNIKPNSIDLVNNTIDINDDVNSFVEVNLSEITRSYNEEVDIKGYTPLINDTNSSILHSSTKKNKKKWINFKKWLPKKNKTSKEKPDDEYNEKEKSKKKFKRQKVFSI